MYGLQAIAANNGWAISVVGITIVFTGLVLLSIAINQIHKLLDLWENRKNFSLFKKKASRDTASEPLVFNESQMESAKQFKLLVSTMEDTFSLSMLLKMAEASGLTKPHSSLNHLLMNRIIVPDSQGYYSWDRDRFNKIRLQPATSSGKA